LPGARRWILFALLVVLAFAASVGSPLWVTQQVTAQNLAYRIFFSPAAGAQVSYPVWLPTGYFAKPTRRDWRDPERWDQASAA
jgi:hypothetical protein